MQEAVMLDRLQGVSEVAFRIMEDKAVEVTDKPGRYRNG